VRDHRERADDEDGLDVAHVEEGAPRRDRLAEPDVVGEQEPGQLGRARQGDRPDRRLLVRAQRDVRYRSRRPGPGPAAQLALYVGLPRVWQGAERRERGRQRRALVQEDAVRGIPAGGAGRGYRAHRERNIEDVHAC
jgi:hypothetical protein